MSNERKFTIHGKYNPEKSEKKIIDGEEYTIIHELEIDDISPAKIDGHEVMRVKNAKITINNDMKYPEVDNSWLDPIPPVKVKVKFPWYWKIPFYWKIWNLFHKN